MITGALLCAFVIGFILLLLGGETQESAVAAIGGLILAIIVLLAAGYGVYHYFINYPINL